MRQWLVVLLAAFAILGTSLPVLASDPPPEVTLPGFLGLGDDSLPTNGDDNEDEDEEDEADDDEDENDEDEDDDEFEEEEREVKVETTDDEVSIELESKSEEREDEVKIEFEAAEGQMTVSFESEQEESEEIETEVEMRVEFREVLEFVDENGDGAFNVGEEVLQSFLIESLEILSLDQSVIEDPEGHQVQVLYAFPEPSEGTLELVFSIFGVPSQLNGLLVVPTEAKIDIVVRDFPFDATDSRLAIDVEFRTEFELETTEEVDLGTIMAQGEEFAAFFEPLPTATVDGTEETVEVTVIEERIEAESGGDEGEFEKRVRLFMAYSQGSVIIHDPLVGIMTVAALVLPGVPRPSLLAYGVGLGTALLLVLGVWVLNERRRR